MVLLSTTRRSLRLSGILLSALLASNLALGLLVLPVQAQVKDSNVALRQAYFASHQAGVRLGGWSNLGTSPPARFDLPSGEYYLTDFNEGNFYLEGYFGYRLNPLLMLEFSLGMVNRGDVILVESPETLSSSVGTMQIYPIMAKLEFYPFGKHARKFYPYLLAGVGLYYGRHDILITAGWDAYFRQQFGQDSKTDFSYVLGGGFDWPVATTVALDLHAQYIPVKFSDDLVGVRDYSSLTVTVGVKYLFSAKEDKKHNYNPRSRKGK